MTLYIIILLVFGLWIAAGLYNYAHFRKKSALVQEALLFFNYNGKERWAYRNQYPILQ